MKKIHQGLEWWDRRYKPIKFLINCVASKKAYGGNMRHYLNKVKGFGDNNIDTRRCVEDDNDNKLGYYEGKDRSIWNIIHLHSLSRNVIS